MSTEDQQALDLLRRIAEALERAYPEKNTNNVFYFGDPDYMLERIKAQIKRNPLAAQSENNSE